MSTVEEIVTEADHVAVRFRVDMTHQGDHLGFPASGKKTALTGSTFAIVKDGKIIEGWNYMNLGAFMQNLKLKLAKVAQVRFPKNWVAHSSLLLA